VAFVAAAFFSTMRTAMIETFVEQQQRQRQAGGLAQDIGRVSTAAMMKATTMK